MFKTALALVLATAFSLNCWAAVDAATLQLQPAAEASKPANASAAIPRPPICWIIPIGCR